MSDFPPFFVTLFLFLDGGLFRNMRLKLAAAALCVAAFMASGWPVVSSLDRSRPGCQWHVVILGFASQFSGPLGVEAAPYDVNREYLDEFAYSTVTSYAARVPALVPRLRRRRLAAPARGSSGTKCPTR